MRENTKILLVEDDPSFGNVLKDYLNMNNFEVTLAPNGQKGVDEFKSSLQYNLVIMDVMMPVKDGFTAAQEIKRIKPNTPLIFLSAKNLKEDILQGYKVGAVDYIIKPFDSEVLLCKIKAITEQSSPSILEPEYDQEEFEIGKFHFNSKIQRLTFEEKNTRLSPKENELLKLLCLYQGELMPRNIALKQIWKEDSYFTSRSMDVYIAKLRKLLKSDPEIMIFNIHGEGFRLVTNKSEYEF